MASPLALAAAKDHLRVDDADEDALIEGLIAAAVDHVERFTGLVLERRILTEGVPGFGGRIRAWPIISVDEVAYVDGKGIDQILDAGSWRLNGVVRPARLSTRTNPWPVVGRLNSTVQITMTAGYEDASDLPGGVMQALKMLVAHFYRNREAVITSGSPVEVPMAVDMLLQPHRLWVL
ncbi:MAG: hypothetical protein EOP94_00590 [Zymomonas sp.]|nr:MAG: hypothetical protein EOP94_00590 [Zymomonas sp.]